MEADAVGMVQRYGQKFSLGGSANMSQMSWTLLKPHRTIRRVKPIEDRSEGIFINEESEQMQLW